MVKCGLLYLDRSEPFTEKMALFLNIMQFCRFSEKLTVKAKEWGNIAADWEFCTSYGNMEYLV